MKTRNRLWGFALIALTLAPWLMGLSTKDRQQIVFDYLRSISGVVAKAPSIDNPNYYSFERLVVGNQECGYYQTSSHQYSRSQVILPTPLPCTGNLTVYGHETLTQPSLLLGEFNMQDAAADLISPLIKIRPLNANSPTLWFATELKSHKDWRYPLYGIFHINSQGSILERYFITDEGLVATTFLSVHDDIHLSTTRQIGQKHILTHMILKRNGSPPVRFQLGEDDLNAILRASLISPKRVYYVIEKPLKALPPLAALFANLVAKELTIYYLDLDKPNSQKLLAIRSSLFGQIGLEWQDDQSALLSIRSQNNKTCYDMVAAMIEQKACTNPNDRSQSIAINTSQNQFNQILALHDLNSSYQRIDFDKGSQP